MKNNMLYNFLLIYEVICSGLLIFLIIKVNILIGRGIHPITAMVIIKQIFEILVFIFFFYIRLKNTFLIKFLMNVVMCAQLIFLGYDLATFTSGKSKSPLLTQIVKILYLLFLFYCRRQRIKEMNIECNNGDNDTVKNN